MIGIDDNNAEDASSKQEDKKAFETDVEPQKLAPMLELNIPGKKPVE